MPVRTEPVSGDNADDFWTWIREIAPPESHPWIISPDAQFAFRLVNGWGESDAGRIGWGNLIEPNRNRGRSKSNAPKRPRCSLVLADRCTIITHTLGDSRLTWVSVGNYLDCDLPAFAASVGIEYVPHGDTGPCGESSQRNPDQAANVIDQYFAELMERYLSDGGGHWRATAAQLSHQTYRRSFCGGELLEHCEPDVYKIERDGLYGGRAEVYYWGTVGDPPGSREGEDAGPPPVHNSTIDGPIHLLDVRSQYPSLLASQSYPVRYLRRHDRCPVPILRQLNRDLRCLARVEIQTHEPAYPLRIGGEPVVSKYRDGGHVNSDSRKSQTRTLFPTGRFWTTLCGPELQDAIDSDRVLRVGEVCEYAMGTPFRKYAEHLLRSRESARYTQDHCRESMLKLLANSFAGKFASKPGGWKTVSGKIPVEPWGEWTERNAESDEPVSYRSISGIVQRFEPQAEDVSGFPSVFAWLTSYGRLQMLRFLRSCGPHAVLWCHTDGLAVTDDGLRRLRDAGLIGDGQPGQLRIVGTASRVRLFGPSHYFVDGEWTLSGMSAGFFFGPGGSVRDYVRPTVSELIASSGCDQSPLAIRSSDLRKHRTGSVAGPFGWSIPPHYVHGHFDKPYLDD